MAKNGKKTDETAVVKQTPPGTLAELGADDFTPEDEKGYEPEKALTVYAQIRQKPVMDEAGKKVLIEPGGFMFRDPTVDDIPDEPELQCVVVGSFQGRVFFKELGDPQPTCKSIDGIEGSHEREVDQDDTTKFGRCEDCMYGQFLGENRPSCREIRNLCVVRRTDPKAFVLTMGPSALKPWRIHDQKLLQQAKRVNPQWRLAPHHLVMVRITTEVRLKPAVHFVPVFRLEGVLPKKDREETRLLRMQLMDNFQRAIQAQEHRVEDYLGPKPTADEEVPF